MTSMDLKRWSIIDQHGGEVYSISAHEINPDGPVVSFYHFPNRMIGDDGDGPAIEVKCILHLMPGWAVMETVDVQQVTP